MKSTTTKRTKPGVRRRPTPEQMALSILPPSTDTLHQMIGDRDKEFEALLDRLGQPNVDQLADAEKQLIDALLEPDHAKFEAYNKLVDKQRWAYLEAGYLIGQAMGQRLAGGLR